MPGGKERKRLRAARDRRDGGERERRLARLLLDSLIAAATIVAAAAAVASAYVAWVAVQQWNLEADDRRLTRQLSQAQVLGTLNQALQQAAHADEFPNARFRVGEAIWQLHELGEPTIIVGDNIVIENADLSCISELDIRAPSVTLTNVYAKHSVINVTGLDIKMNRLTLDDVHVGLFPSTPINMDPEGEPQVTPPLSFRMASSIGHDFHVIAKNDQQGSLTIANSYLSESSLSVRSAPLVARFSYFDDVFFAVASSPKGFVAGFKAPAAPEGSFAVDPQSVDTCIYDKEGTLASGASCPPPEQPILRSLKSFGVFPHGAWFLLKPGEDPASPTFADDHDQWDQPDPPDPLQIEDIVGAGARSSRSANRPCTADPRDAG